jgi:uncharacterized membrane protein
MTSDSQTQAAMEKETGRLESFSDGVFSVAITLLVLDLNVPNPRDAGSPGALWHALIMQWPSYFAFVTSFFTVLIMWMNHHAVFRLVRKTSARLLFANGILLLLVTAVPFSTKLVAAYLKSPAAWLACMIYAGLFVLVSIAYNALLWAAHRDCREEMDQSNELLRRQKLGYLVGFPLYLLATIAAPFSIWITLGICTALWIFWAVATVE